MEYLLFGCGLLAAASRVVLRPAQYSGELKAAGRTIADLRALEERHPHRARRDARPSSGNASSRRVSRPVSPRRSPPLPSRYPVGQRILSLSETFKALSQDALNQNNQAFIQLADKTMQAVLAEMKGDFEQRRGGHRRRGEAPGGLPQALRGAAPGHRGDQQAAYGDISRHISELVKMQDRLADQTSPWPRP
jgi:DNA recombination protein RmuC